MEMQVAMPPMPIPGSGGDDTIMLINDEHTHTDTNNINGGANNNNNNNDVEMVGDDDDDGGDAIDVERANFEAFLSNGPGNSHYYLKHGYDPLPPTATETDMQRAIARVFFRCCPIEVNFYRDSVIKSLENRAIYRAKVLCLTYDKGLPILTIAWKAPEVAPAQYTQGQLAKAYFQVENPKYEYYPNGWKELCFLTNVTKVNVTKVVDGVEVQTTESKAMYIHLNTILPHDLRTNVSAFLFPLSPYRSFYLTLSCSCVAM